MSMQSVLHAVERGEELWRRNVIGRLVDHIVPDVFRGLPACGTVSNFGCSVVINSRPNVEYILCLPEQSTSEFRSTLLVSPWFASA